MVNRLWGIYVGQSVIRSVALSAIKQIRHVVCACVLGRVTDTTELCY